MCRLQPERRRRSTASVVASTLATAVAAWTTSATMAARGPAEPPAGPGVTSPAPPASPSDADADRQARLAAWTRQLLAGDTAGVRARLQSHLADHPDDARATFLLGMTHHRERNYAAAAPLMERALELDPRDASVHHFLGWARLHLGELDAAAVAFERHWILQPGEPDTIFGLGLVALESGDDALAERRFRETIGLIRSFEESNPAAWNARRRDQGKCHARLGEIAFARGDLEQARRELERALSIDPGQTTAWYVLSRVQRRLGDQEKARIALDRFRVASGRAEPPSLRADDPARAETGGGDPVGPPAEPTSRAARSGAAAPAVATPPPPAIAMPPVPADAPPFSFTDVTAASGLAFTTTSGRDPSTVIAEVKAGGLALVDHDRDGDLDILIPNGATLEAPDDGPGARLYENLGGMRFRDVTDAAGLGSLRGWSMGIAAGDVDGDGWTDLYVTCLGPDRLLLGGPGGFRDATVAAGIDVAGWSTAASMGDVDGDGDLDILVSGYIRMDPRDPPAPSTFRGLRVPAGPRGLPPAVDTLLENRGDGTFRDVSVASGLRDVEPGYGLATAILDLDGDGTPELFVGNDSMPNRLLRRGDDGRLRDDGLVSGLAISGDGAPRATMGLAIGDLDDDGRADVFTTNFAGEPNSAHVATADGYHEDASSRLALAADSRGVLGWGCAIEDLDHDGQVEVLVVNGHVYPGATRATMLADESQPPLLMRRSPPLETGPSATADDPAVSDPARVRYERVPVPDAPDDPRAWLGHAARDRTLLLGDLDGDGDLDAVIGGLNQPVRLLRNDGSHGHWLIVAPATRPQGCTVEIRRAGRTWRRWIVSGTGYCSAAAPVAHVGLGASDAPVSVTVRWADGVTVTRTGVPVDQHLTIDRPSPTTSVAPE